MSEQHLGHRKLSWLNLWNGPRSSLVVEHGCFLGWSPFGITVCDTVVPTFNINLFFTFIAHKGATSPLKDYCHKINHNAKFHLYISYTYM